MASKPSSTMMPTTGKESKPTMIPTTGKELGLYTIGWLAAYSFTVIVCHMIEQRRVEKDTRYQEYGGKLYKLPLEKSPRYGLVQWTETFQAFSLLVTMFYCLIMASFDKENGRVETCYPWLTKFQVLFHPLFTFVIIILYSIAITIVDEHCYMEEETNVEGHHKGFSQPQEGPLQCDFSAGDVGASCNPTHPGVVACITDTLFTEIGSQYHALEIFNNIMQINPASATVLLFASIFFTLYPKFSVAKDAKDPGV